MSHTTLIVLDPATRAALDRYAKANGGEMDLDDFAMLEPIQQSETAIARLRRKALRQMGKTRPLVSYGTDEGPVGTLVRHALPSTTTVDSVEWPRLKGDDDYHGRWSYGTATATTDGETVDLAWLRLSSRSA